MGVMNLGLPTSLTSIDNDAFYELYNFNMSYFVGNDGHIEGETFEYLKTPPNLKQIGFGAFRYIAQKVDPIHIELNNGLTSIGGSCFYDGKIKSIYLPTSLTSFGDACFEGLIVPGNYYEDEGKSIGELSISGRTCE
jgi:hypothetical protein